VSWIATANEVSHLDPNLLDRVRVITLPEPGLLHVEAHAWFAFQRMLEREEETAQFEETLDEVEIEAVRRSWTGRSFRGLDRVVEAIWKTREAQRVRH
jgi:ATP-dependent Lon protease